MEVVEYGEQFHLEQDRKHHHHRKKHHHSKLINIHNEDTEKMCAINLHMKHFRKQVDYKDMLAHILDVVSRGLLLSQKNGYDQYLVFIYMDEFKMKETDPGFFKNLIQILMSTFPESLHQCYVVNFPTVLKSMYAVVTSVLDRRGKERIIFVKRREDGTFSKTPTVDW